MNNNNNNISKKAGGYSQCRQFLCYIISEQGIKLWTAEGQIHLHVVFEVRLEHRIAIPVYWLLSHAVTSPRRYKPIRKVELFWF